MKTLVPEVLAEEILSIAREAQGAFPYTECEKLARHPQTDYQSLVSDLDTYFYDVWSAGNGAKNLARKSDAWLSDLRTYLEKHFFVHYPQYALLAGAINQDDTPDLYRRLGVVETLRLKLSLYLAELLDLPKVAG